MYPYQIEWQSRQLQWSIVTTGIFQEGEKTKFYIALKLFGHFIIIMFSLTKLSLLANKDEENTHVNKLHFD